MPGAVVGSSTRVLTEEILIEKLAKNTTVKALNISGLDLEEFDPTVFKIFPSVEILDLSKNSLRYIPAELRLPKLKKLDVSENRLTSVEFITQFPTLEELYIEQNIDLEPSDRYIAAALLPSLKVVDKNKISSLSKVVSSTKDKLQPEIQRIWEEEFVNQCDGECADLEEKLISKVKEAKHQRHVSLAKFTDFMIEHLCREHLRGLNRRSSKRRRSMHTSPEPSSKRRKVENGACPSPRKTPTKASQMEVSPTVTPRKSPRMGNSPRKMVNSPRKSANVSPDVSRCVTESPRKSPRKACKKVAWEEQDDISLPPVSDYDPVHFVRCHFGDKKAKKEGHGLNDPTDCYTPVWACAFEPNPNNPEETTNIVATCGGHTVCLVDCCTGSVLKRYQNTKMEFYCVAWTTLTMEHEGREWQSNVLAVAGSDGYVKLLHPEQLVCYREFGSNKPKVACQKHMTTSIVFEKEEPELMYCANSDSSITVWDIGVPSGPDYSTDITPIRTLVSNAGSVQCLVATDKHLVAGCEEALSVWKFPIQAANNQRRHQAPCVRLQTPEEEDQSVNSMVLLSEDIVACNMLESSKIYLWSLSATLTLKSVKVKQAVVKPLMMLDWVQLDVEDIGLGFMNGILGCGDDKGSIMLYNLKKALAQKEPSKDLVKASRVIQWPECVLDSTREEEKKMTDVTEKDAPVVNCVTFSSSCEYLVTGTDNNLLCIWKKIK